MNTTATRSFRASWPIGAAVFLAALAIDWPARGENWPQWRNARLDGISHETNLPTTWSQTENVVWRLPLPGSAGATPVVWEDKIFLTSADGENLLLMCVGVDGKERWRQVMGDGNHAVRNDEGNLASPSPSTDGKHVWAMVGTGELACFTVAGKPTWRFNLQDRYGAFKIAFGMASTPVLDNGRLYLQIIHSGGAEVVCLNASDGKEIWKQPRPSDARAECEQSYASPIIYREGDRQMLLTHGADYIIAFRLDSGAEIWRCGGLNPKGAYNNTLRLVASPVAAPGVIIVPSAKNGPVLALSPDNHGDITDGEEGHLWQRAHDTPDVPSPLVVDGLAYLCRENGTLLCLDARTGKEFYQKRAHADRHRASPVYGDGKIYLTARDGTISVVKAGPNFELLASNDMGESTSSSPVISGGRIYIRTFEALYAVGKP